MARISPEPKLHPYWGADALLWVESTRSLRGKPFRFDYRGNRPYISAIYNSRAKRNSVMKARQVEMSEWALNTGLRFCDLVPFVNLMHVFPTSPVASKFSRERLEMAISGSPILTAKIQQRWTARARAKDRVENVLQKKIGNSFYSMAASFQDYGGRGPSCDGLIFDEYDKQSNKIEAVFRQSLAHSEWALRLYLSTPTVPDRAIDTNFKRGSGHRWFYLCRCGHDQELRWPNNVLDVPAGADAIPLLNLPTTIQIDPAWNRHRHYFGCEKCGKPLEREIGLADTGGQFGGRWVAGNPDLVGIDDSWHLTWFMAPWKFAEDMVAERREIRFDQLFDNEILGIPSEPEDAGIRKEHLYACMRHGVRWEHTWPNMGQVCVGVDWGDVSWVVVRGRGIDPVTGHYMPRILYIERIDSPNALDHAPAAAKVFETFGCNGIMVCDSGYGRDRNEYLAKKFPGKVFSAYYPVMAKSAKTFRPQWQPAQGKVTMDRTSTLKLTLREYIDKEVYLPGVTDDRMIEYIRHFGNIRVIKEIEEETHEVHEVIVATGDGADHYVHASNYARVGYEGIWGYYKQPETSKPFVQSVSAKDDAVPVEGEYDDGSDDD